MSDLLARIERAAVRGWPALESAAVGRWLWRFTSGGSIRANSVAALDDPGMELAEAITRCESLYAARGAPCVFTISDASLPRDLDARLTARGYVRGDAHVTMAKPVAGAAPVTDAADVVVSATPSDGWMAAYLSGLSPDRRAIAPRLIANLPPGAGRFVSAIVAGRVAASGLTMLDGHLASVQCMATLPEARRLGSAGRVLKAIETVAAAHGARHLYLQTSGDNAAAQALYARHGYVVVGHYHTRTRTL